MHACFSVAISFFLELSFDLFYSVGIVFNYGIFQLCVWWFCHVVSLFWGIRFPFHFRSFKTAHRLKYVHIPMVIAGLVLPALPVTLISTAEVQDSSLPSSNSSQSASLIFYSLILPSNLVFAAGIPLLIIIIWLIHKVIMITTNTGNNSCELIRSSVHHFYKYCHCGLVKTAAIATYIHV